MLHLQFLLKRSTLSRENCLFEACRAMSKNKKGKNDAKVAQSSKSEEKDDSAVIIDKSNNILINILAKPGAKQNCITGRYATNATSELFSCKQPEEQQCECGCISDITPEGVAVQINAPPAEGEANAELVRYISSLLGIRKGDVSLYKGFKSRQKTIKVEAGSLSIEEVRQKINDEILKK